MADSASVRNSKENREEIDLLSDGDAEGGDVQTGDVVGGTSEGHPREGHPREEHPAGHPSESSMDGASDQEVLATYFSLYSFFLTEKLESLP
jgi:hypothetical protein